MDYHPPPTALRRRFWITTSFLAHTLVEIWWWEIMVPYRLRLGLLNRNSEARRQGWAREFRAFALTMGGVWIKLGQFFSSRADLLPPDITAILADLQDEVAPVPWPAIRQQVVRELERPPEEVFQEFDTEPHAAASLGQVHQAWLPNGRCVAVKVQRPGIRAIVDVDLRALRWVINWLKNFAFVRRRANLDALYNEFADSLSLELDYIQEGRHAELFAENFRDDPQVEVPRPYWPLTTTRVLVLEWVEGIKVNHYAALEAAGVPRAAVAEKLFATYLKQVFEDGFFHADPHPGNLYIRPAPDAEGSPGAFELLFIDFGMVGHISDRDRTLLRRMVIATVQRDYGELVRLAKEIGFLLPDADNRTLIAALEALFERFYGLSMSELTTIGYDEVQTLTLQFRDLLYDFPFQLPQDFIMLGRTLAILSGIATGLDPEFSPVAGLEPFARRLIGAEAGTVISGAAREAGEMAAVLVALPRRLERLLRRVEDGDLTTEATAPLGEAMAGIEGAINRLTDTMLMMAFSAGWYFIKGEEKPLSYAANGMLLAAGWAVWRLARGSVRRKT